MASAARPRIVPLEPPYSEAVAKTLGRMMPPGMEPLKLFRTLAHHPHILERVRSTGAYLLNHGTLPARDREIVMLRTTALCGSEYEWGVHAAFYGTNVGLTAEQVTATTVLLNKLDAAEPAWSDRDRLLLRLSEVLHESSQIPEDLWPALSEEWTAEQLIELVTLAGQYHTISYITNALGIELEEGAARFPAG